jgi:hypothetical protein
MRKFKTGATRDNEEGKFDYEGFYNPLVIKRFGQYMDKHRKQADGKLRDSDNWQKGIPKDAYIKSAWRHFIDWWMEHRGYKSREGIEDALCALLFNVQGYLFEILKNKEDRPFIEKEEIIKPTPLPVICIECKQSKHYSCFACTGKKGNKK